MYDGMDLSCLMWVLSLGDVGYRKMHPPTTPKRHPWQPQPTSVVERRAPTRMGRAGAKAGWREVMNVVLEGILEAVLSEESRGGGGGVRIAW